MRDFQRLSLDEYQERAISTAIYPLRGRPGSLHYLAPGLAGEAGEFAGHWAKAVRDDEGIISEQRKSLMMKELGDTLWMIACAANELGYSLESVGRHNLHKLQDRKQRGVLGGSGDER